MAKNQLKKCLWVLDTIYRTGGISYKDIADRWDREHGDDEMGKLSNSTFRYYIDLLQDLLMLISIASQVMATNIVSRANMTLTDIMPRAGF